MITDWLENSFRRRFSVSWLRRAMVRKETLPTVENTPASITHQSRNLFRWWDPKLTGGSAWIRKLWLLDNSYHQSPAYHLTHQGNHHSFPSPLIYHVAYLLNKYYCTHTPLYSRSSKQWWRHQRNQSAATTYHQPPPLYRRLIHSPTFLNLLNPTMAQRMEPRSLSWASKISWKWSKCERKWRSDRKWRVN